MRAQRRQRARQLHGNGRDELARRLELAAAARKEEAGAEAPAAEAGARDGPRDGRFAGAGHSVEPVDALEAVASAAATIAVDARPCQYVVEDLGLRVRQAYGLFLMIVVVEHGPSGVRQLLQLLFLIWVGT
jgi:hypothetical protein